MHSIDSTVDNVENDFNFYVIDESNPILFLEEKIKSLIKRDLERLNWEVFTDKNLTLFHPAYYNKKAIKEAMSIRRDELLLKNKKWIDKHIKIAKENLASGKEVLKSKIEPIIEVCENQKQKNLFRIFRYYWSSPYSEYVGRRIKLLIRDNALPRRPVIGIIAIGSSIIHIPERDKWIGWDKETRTKNLINTMDAYVIGALPPYNYLLGGKLVSYILASNEVRKIYKRKYKNIKTILENRKASDLVCIFTTGLYGKSSQYNRIKYNEELLYIPIGETKGYGTLHLTEETFETMLEFLKLKNITVNNKFGDGPIWKMRVIRTIGDILGIDSECLLKHSFKRSIYAIPLAKNFRPYLKDKEDFPDYYDYPMEEMVSYWKNRWLLNRKKKQEIIDNVLSFKKEDFNIYF